eukprot:CAMPEP_0174708716 /NCGR_PEP_ID=MMETSP1094-20130205/10891_1 /TAXON_ID=156173 /ORGANISM="Chrysochromulina brevifilum, Strain UTEX LB 985" /LENGTH=41 /DNA_ID= /DNA_START= /DNA_END= /DNA_ORIENTATION=
MPTGSNGLTANGTNGARTAASAVATAQGRTDRTRSARMTGS